LSLAKNIKRLRRAAELTQEGLAEKLGVKQGAVSKWETEKADPPASILPTLAVTVGVRLDELFEHVDSRYDRARKGEAPAPFTPDTPEQVEAHEVAELWPHVDASFRPTLKILLYLHDTRAARPAQRPAGARPAVHAQEATSTSPAPRQVRRR
jgi:transcriptional regulator with XRE-family HTH domain